MDLRKIQDFEIKITKNKMLDFLANRNKAKIKIECWYDGGVVKQINSVPMFVTSEVTVKLIKNEEIDQQCLILNGHVGHEQLTDYRTLPLTIELTRYKNINPFVTSLSVLLTNEETTRMVDPNNNW